MSAAQWGIVAHVIVFGAWFGTDLATFALSRRVVNSSIEPSARLVLASAMMSVEVVARLCLPCTLGTGVFIAQQLGWVSWPSWIGIAALIAAASWAGLVWTIHRSGEQAIGARLTRIDLAIRSVICAGLWAIVVWSSATDNGPVRVNWLILKVALFALVMTCGISIRFLLRPFSAAFGAIVANGSTPEREIQLQRAIRTAQPFVVVIWASLLTATLMGLVKIDI